MHREPVLQQVLMIARKIVHEEVSPYTGAAAIWSAMAEENSEYPEELGIFVGLASEWQDNPDQRDAYEEDIRDEAQGLLKRHTADGD